MHKVTLLLTLIAFGYQGYANISDTALLPCQQNADKVLTEALTCMKKHYYKRDWVQWDELADAARTRLRNSGKCDDANEAISWCFEQLREPHSFLMAADRAARYNNDLSPTAAPPAMSELVGEIKGELLGDSIAYLTVPWISSDDSTLCSYIADSLQSLIASLDMHGINRWIVDLRKNTGGNCWPMLAGIGPLIGEGVCGYFVGDNERVTISYKNGEAWQGRHIRCKTSRGGYRTRNNDRSIVVLTGRKTVSAGEIVAMAFKGRERTYLFGEPTAGLTTANATYSLSDHSMLVLSVCKEADHTGRIWEGSIQPDRLIWGTAAAGAKDDPVKTAAIDWLQPKGQ